MKSLRHRTTLEAYRLAGQAAVPLMRARYAQRVRDGLEEAGRVQEHFGRASAARDDGCWVWFHGGNADDVRSLLPLVRLCVAQNLQVVGTAQCRYGLALWEQEAARNPSLVAQYAPVDVDRCVNRFLSHWQPDLAVTVADQVMPSMATCLQKRNVSCVVVGGLLSERAHEFWSVRPKLARKTFSTVKLVAAADAANAEMFREMGAPNVEVCGDLAADAPVKADSPREHGEFWRGSGLPEERRSWLATPTNAAELSICLEAQRALKLAGTDVVCALSPPPSVRLTDIEAAVQTAALLLGRPSLAQADDEASEPWAADADVLLFAFGEEGERAAFRSDAIYLGGALGGGASGGLSPVPAILHRLAIASGENVQRHLALISRLNKNEAVRLVSTGEDLAAFLSVVLQDQTAHRRMTEAALTTLWPMQGAVNTTYIALDPFLRPLVYKARMDSILPLGQAAE